jgi:ferredoxin
VSTTSLIALGIGLIMALGLVVSLGALSLLSGAMDFFFGGAKLFILKSQYGKQGFAFGLNFNKEKDPARYDEFKIDLYNPSGEPTRYTFQRGFPAKSDSFALDVNCGEEMEKLISAKGFNDALVEVSVYSVKDGSTFKKNMKAIKFLEQVRNAKLSFEDFEKKHKVVKTPPLYTIPGKSFVAPPLPKSEKVLKLATNPEFKDEFSSSTADQSSDEKQENFSIAKVWIEPGCIVCDACETIYPEVFEVQDETCVIRPGYPKDDGLKVQEAAEACPVEVIKFAKA